jgi:hypothetical protein
MTYSGDFLRRGDSNRFLMTLFAPYDRRAALWALFAFNLEIARTRDVVSEHTLGLIRLQWWRDRIDAIYEGRPVPGHDILADLARAIEAYHLPRTQFETMIAAREQDLDAQPFNGPDAVQDYIDQTAAPLMQLANIITGGGEDDETVRMHTHAYAISGILRSVAQDSERFKAGADEISALSRDLCGKAAEALHAPPKTRLFAAQAAIARIELKRIAGFKYNVLDKRLCVPAPFLALRCWWALRMTVKK